MSCTHEWRIEYVPVDACQKCRARQEEVEAFRRGAEAMREACAMLVLTANAVRGRVDADALRVLPIPEEP